MATQGELLRRKKGIREPEHNNNVPAVIEEKVTMVAADNYDEITTKAFDIAVYLQKHVLDKREGLVKNGKRHIEFSEWQTVAKYYEVTVKTKTLSIMGSGIDLLVQAEGIAVHNPTGKEVGYGEGFCERRENGKGSHTLHQIASMAQTRAGSKAMKNALGWVVELAGISSTPWEEVEDLEEKKNKGSKNGNDKRVKPNSNGKKKTENSENTKKPDKKVQKPKEDKKSGKGKDKPIPEIDNAVDAEYTTKPKEEKKEEPSKKVTNEWEGMTGREVIDRIITMIDEDKQVLTDERARKRLQTLNKYKSISKDQFREANIYLKSLNL
jgi:hypothetical protein